MLIHSAEKMGRTVVKGTSLELKKQNKTLLSGILPLRTLASH
jgi:hypothetical protein